MKLAKTIQLDVSDKHIYEHRANPQEWAIVGTFYYMNSDPNNWSKKNKFAFQSAWLGLTSYGNSTFVQVTEIIEYEYHLIIESLAKYLVERYNAPSIEDAKYASKKEIDDMTALCDHPPGTLLSVERSLVENGIKEKIRVIKPIKKQRGGKAWSTSQDE